MGGEAWTKEADKYIREHYATKSTEEIAQNLKRTVKSVYYRANRIGARKSKEVIRRDSLKNYITNENFRKKQWPKGHKPWNAGKKWPDQPEGCRKSQFTEGHEPHNTKHDGAISLRKDKTGTPYYFIRISKANWVPLQRYLWEKEKGKIPKGGVVRFKNNNTLDVRIENLELITKSENMLKNSIYNYPEDVRKAMHLVGVANRLINKKNKNNGKEHN